MVAAHNLIGWRFGQLAVVARHENDTTGKTQWVCKCDCGGAHIARSDNLIHNRTTRCYRCQGIRTPTIVTVYAHVKPMADPTMPGALTTGYAGFATFVREDKELIAPVWYEGRQRRGAPHVVLVESIRRAAAAGLIKCQPDKAQVGGWIRRHKAHIHYQLHNEGYKVWGAWHQRTGEWKGTGTVDEQAIERLL